jgi:hypothetical protein
MRAKNCASVERLRVAWRSATPAEKLIKSARELTATGGNSRLVLDFVEKAAARLKTAETN